MPVIARPSWPASRPRTAGPRRHAPGLSRSARTEKSALVSSPTRSLAAGLMAAENIGHYVAAMRSLVGLMRTLALEVAPDSIRVSSPHRLALASTVGPWVGTGGIHCSAGKLPGRNSMAAQPRTVHVPYTLERDEDGVWCAHAWLGSSGGANGNGATPDEAIAGRADGARRGRGTRAAPAQPGP